MKPQHSVVGYFNIPSTDLQLRIKRNQRRYLVGAYIIETIAKAQKTAMHAIKRGRADENVQGSRHWVDESVILYLDPSPHITYRELRSVLVGMDYWVQAQSWTYPTTYDVHRESTGAKKAFLCILTPEL